MAAHTCRSLRSPGFRIRRPRVESARCGVVMKQDQNPRYQKASRASRSCLPRAVAICFPASAHPLGIRHGSIERDCGVRRRWAGVFSWAAFGRAPADEGSFPNDRDRVRLLSFHEFPQGRGSPLRFPHHDNPCSSSRSGARRVSDTPGRPASLQRPAVRHTGKEPL